MSEHLENARRWWVGADLLNEEPESIREAVGHLLLHLESQSASQPARESEKPSSVATETAEETKPISRTFWTQSYRASPDGNLLRLVATDILALSSSAKIVGGEQVEVTIRTLTSKASTPPTGLESLILRPSGVAGSVLPEPTMREPDRIEEIWGSSSTAPASGDECYCPTALANWQRANAKRIGIGSWSWHCDSHGWMNLSSPSPASESASTGGKEETR